MSWQCGVCATALHGLAAFAFTFACTWAAFWAAVCFLRSPCIVNVRSGPGATGPETGCRFATRDNACCRLRLRLVAMERLEKVELRLRQGCSGVELPRQGIAGLQRRGTAACAQAAAARHSSRFRSSIAACAVPVIVPRASAPDCTSSSISSIRTVSAGQIISAAIGRAHSRQHSGRCSNFGTALFPGT